MRSDVIIEVPREDEVRRMAELFEAYPYGPFVCDNDGYTCARRTLHPEHGMGEAGYFVDDRCLGCRGDERAIPTDEKGELLALLLTFGPYFVTEFLEKKSP
jgi:hypothetical protein